MPDDMEFVQDINEQFRVNALAEHQRTREPACYTGTGCVVCKHEIPEARRLAQPGCCRCVSCQADFELLNNWRAL